MSTTQELDYVAVAKCGHVRVWISYLAAQRKESRRTISECIREGLSIERMTTEQSKAAFARCEVCDPPKKPRKSRARPNATGELPL